MSRPGPNAPPGGASEPEPEPATVAGLSGLGGRPSLHPAWREPEAGTLANPAAPAPVLVLRLAERKPR